MNIVLDMDETLLSSASRHLDPNTPLPKINLGVVEGVQEAIALRPYTVELLTFCKANFDRVICCSFSSRQRVQTLLKGGDILRYFSDIYGGDDVEELNGVGPELGEFILIDDYDWNTWLIQDKLKFFGFDTDNFSNFHIVSDYHIKVGKFKGSVQDIDFFNLIPRLKARLGKGNRA